MALTKSITYQEATYENAYIRISRVDYYKNGTHLFIDVFSSEESKNNHEPCLFQGAVNIPAEYCDEFFTVAALEVEGNNNIKAGYVYLKQCPPIVEVFPIDLDLTDAIDI
jgi:hypothetical protein